MSTPKRLSSSRCADFETTTDPLDCRVWCWGSMAINDYDDYVTGIGLGSYIAHLFSKPAITYFHNLAFDGSFILDYILKGGYKWVAKDPGPGEFTTLISGMGKFYSITIISRTKTRVELRDSLKKIPLKVSDVPKAFNLESEKGEIDYEAFRPIGYLPTEEEWKYLYNDIFIMAQAMRVIHASGMDKLTVGADSLAEYKQDLRGLFQPYQKRSTMIFGQPIEEEFPYHLNIGSGNGLGRELLSTKIQCTRGLCARSYSHTVVRGGLKHLIVRLICLRFQLLLPPN